VIQRQGKAEGGRLVDDGWVQVCSAERGARLRRGGFEAAEIPNPGRAASLIEQGLMEIDDVAQRKLAHQARRL
jgi:hypothetical protein